jgi:HAD superfamily hydrolase (TIGR01509 family)
MALVIFDCDGVLIDSEVLSQREEAACLAAHGFPVPLEEVATRYLGISGAAMFADLEARFGRKVPQALIDDLRDRIAAACETELAAMPGIHDLLDRLPVPVCVASSSRPERLAHTLGLTGLYHRFAPNIFSASQVANGKPAPDLFLFAAARMGVAPDSCIVVEDSVAGVRAGVAAGMTVYGFCGGGHCPPDHGRGLLAAGASAVFAHMDALAAPLEHDRIALKQCDP